MAKQPWVSIDAGVVPVENRPQNWNEAKHSPCATCQTAPCCTYLPLHAFRVDTMFELDHAGYLLNFDRIELGLTANGDWGVYYRYPCRHLDRDNFLCHLHGSIRQPHICRNYNPYSCWYRKVLRAPTSEAYLRLDRPRIKFIIANCVFDDDRNIVDVPSWDAMKTAFVEIPCEQQHIDEENSDNDAVFDGWLREVTNDVPTKPSRILRKFDELQSPCDECNAYCCRTLVFPHGTPTSASNLDYLRFCLGFPGIELAISDIEWSLVVKTRCRHLDGNRCTLYQQPERPLICRYYDEINCSYKWQFGETRPDGFLRIRYEQFDSVLDSIGFDDNGFIVDMPRTDRLRSTVERSIRATVDTTVTELGSGHLKSTA